MSKKLGEMSPEERQAAIARAARRIQAELTAAAPEISRILDEAEAAGEKAVDPRPAHGYRAQVPGFVAEYFGAKPEGMTEHPVIAQQYWPALGWRRTAMRKRVSLSWLRKLKAQGVTAVQLACGGYQADFSIDEIIRYARRPLLGGTLI